MRTNTLTNADLTNLITLVGFTIGNGSDLPDKWFTTADDLIQKLATIRDDESARRVADAAPDLLEALQECITDDPSRFVGLGRWERRLKAINDVASAAITKATGATT